jgi:small subunit ribosomal protein S4
LVNGSLLNIPSYLLKPGDVITVREQSKSLENINNSLARRKAYNWLQWDGTNYQGTFLAFPEREDIPEKIKEQLIVELYSK